MIAGRLKYRLQLYKPEESAGKFGMEASSYTESRTIRAERVNIRGDRRIELHEIYPDYKVTYRVRSSHSDITEGWRLREVGTSMLFEVCNVIPDKERGLLTLECEKVNE